MCEYCGKPYKEIVPEVAELVRIEPLPAINLTTGEKAESAEPPYYAIRVLWVEDGYDTVQEYIPAKYCPMCGRKLDRPASD